MKGFDIFGLTSFHSCRTPRLDEGELRLLWRSMVSCLIFVDLRSLYYNSNVYFLDVRKIFSHENLQNCYLSLGTNVKKEVTR